MRKFWIFTLPLVIIIPLGYFILGNGAFNMIPFAIHELFGRQLIGESKFIVGFNLVILLTIYLITYRLLKRKTNNEPLTSATRQVRQQWFSVCIFPLRQFFGLTGKYHAVSHSNVLGKQKA
jgi:hypothetical protein